MQVAFQQAKPALTGALFRERCEPPRNEQVENRQNRPPPSPLASLKRTDAAPATEQVE